MILQLPEADRSIITEALTHAIKTTRVELECDAKLGLPLGSTNVGSVFDHYNAATENPAKWSDAVGRVYLHIRGEYWGPTDKTRKSFLRIILIRCGWVGAIVRTESTARMKGIVWADNERVDQPLNMAMFDCSYLRSLEVALQAVEGKFGTREEVLGALQLPEGTP